MNIKLVIISALGMALAACGGSDNNTPDNVDGTVTISGTTTENETLTATVSDENGTSGVTITYAWSAGGTAIQGATSATFVPSDEQVDSALTVTATYTDEDGYSESATSPATAAIAGVNDAGSVAISGDAVVGEELTATVSDVDGVSGTVTYQWSASGTAISGATSAAFTPAVAQLGSTLTVTAAYTDDQGFAEDLESSATEAVTTTAVNSSGSITITGTTTEGETLTASVTDTNGTTTSTIVYAWSASGTTISGATSSTYVLTAGEVGDTITANATYTDDDGFAEDITSTATEAVAGALVNTEGTVSVAGTTTVGETLTATVTDLNGTTGSTIVYEWRAGGTAISGATASTYVLTASEIGAAITVNVTYTDDGGFAEDNTSSATSAVIAVNTVGTIGAITGTTTEGETLTAAAISDANGVTGATFMYQWAAGGTNISGATSSTYVLTAEEIGDTITVTVGYTDDDGYDESVTSAATEAVAAAATNTAGTATITSDGTLLVGDTLTANITDTNGTTGAAFVYQWEADGSDISGATSNTYALTTAEAGSVITVNVTYTDDDSFEEDITSAAATGEDSTNRVFTVLVSDTAELTSALGTVAAGDWVVLDGGAADYADMGEVDVNVSITMTKTATATPEISGSMCLVLSADNITVDGLTFSSINWIDGGTCDSNNNASVYLSGDGITLSNNTFASEADPVNTANTTNSWVVLKGVDSLVTRNTFIGKDANRKGGFITLASSSSGGDKTGHIVEYNLFKDMVSSDGTPDSSAYALQVGSSTGTDANNPSNFIVRYNRFENCLGGRRLMRVQTTNATIEGNTVIDSYGAISLEDGMSNTVQDNIIIRTTSAGTGDDASGILAHRFGHIISNNYIAGMHSNDKTLGGIVFSVNEIGEYNSGLAALSADTTTDFTMTVERNTVLNSEQPIVFSESWPDDATGEDCDDIVDATTVGLTKNTFIINFDNNLIINGLNTNTAVEGAFLDADVSTSDHTIEYDCDLLDYSAPGVSAFANNHSFTDSRVSGTASGSWTDVTNLNGNEFGGSDRGQDQMPTGDDIAEFQAGNDSLIEGTGGEAAIGADTSDLDLIESDDVGADSTWTFGS